MRIRLWIAILPAAALLLACGAARDENASVAQAAPAILAAQAGANTQPRGDVQQQSPTEASPLTSRSANQSTAARLPNQAPAGCPVTPLPDPPFVPPDPYAPSFPYAGSVWYGSPQLWTTIPDDGSWKLARNTDGYFDKSYWWREGFNGVEESEPKLEIAATRLDAMAPEYAWAGGTNGNHADLGWFMLTGIELATPGCWEITGTYNDHSLSFVVWVAP